MATAVHPGPAGAAPFDGRASASWPGLAPGVLDLLHEAVLVLGRDARLLGSNRAAAGLLSEGDGLTLSAGRLVASTSDATQALHRGVERAARGEAGRVQVPRFGRTSLTLLVERHPQAGSGSPAAVVFATERGGRGPRDEDLAARHGLTPAECSVAQRLCAGVDLECIARELDISLSTVRGHLKQIFGKTQSHRQAELVCKLLSER